MKDLPGFGRAGWGQSGMDLSGNGDKGLSLACARELHFAFPIVSLLDSYLTSLADLKSELLNL